MAAKKSWSELSTGKKASVLGVVAVQAVVAAFVQADLAARPKDRVRGPKLLWRLASFNTLGSVAYVFFGRR